MYFYNEKNNEETQVSSLEHVTQNLVLHLDAGDVNSYPGSGTDWLDLSGNGNNAVLVSNPTFTNTNGGEFSGFGSYGSGGYARVPHNSSIAPTSQITISAWAYSDDWAIGAASYPRQILSKTQGGAYSMGSNNEGAYSQIYIPGKGYMVTKQLTTPGWHNLAYSYNGSAVIFYIDGVNVQEIATSGNISYSYSNALLIGREAGAGSTPQAGYDWPGKVAIVMLYDRGITSAEVLQNFEAEKSRFGL